MDRQVKLRGIKAAEIQVLWGIPDWTKAENYPVEITDNEWRWEFLRRRPDYRHAWEERKSDAVTHRFNEGEVHCIDDGNWDLTRLRFGVMFIHDPKRRMSDLLLSRLGVFCPLHGLSNTTVVGNTLSAARLRLYTDSSEQEIQEREERESTLARAGIVEYRFSLAQSLEPQIRDARVYLRRMQMKTYGRKGTQRPSRELWPLYLRVLDARDCGASWKNIAKTFWGSDTVKDKARRTHEMAMAVRDNFPT